MGWNGQNGQTKQGVNFVFTFPKISNLIRYNHPYRARETATQTNGLDYPQCPRVRRWTAHNTKPVLFFPPWPHLPHELWNEKYKFLQKQTHETQNKPLFLSLSLSLSSFLFKFRGNASLLSLSRALSFSLEHVASLSDGSISIPINPTAGEFWLRRPICGSC